jgi:adenosylcobinamide-GDP ribazoletransferase
MKTDNMPRKVTEVLVALVLLTRLPLPHLPPGAFARGASAVWAYPLAGALLGGCAAVVGNGLLAIGLPASFAAGGLLATLVVLSGAMHEDGLADTVDGFWGGHDPQRRLEIMKDSRIGTYGVLALILVTGLRWSAYAALLPYGVLPVIATAALSRSAMPLLMTGLPPARASGLSQGVGRPGRATSLAGLVLALGIATICLGATALPAFAIVLLAALFCGLCAHAKILGQTGDTLGATQQISETAVLAVLVLLLAR